MISGRKSGTQRATFANISTPFSVIMSVIVKKLLDLGANSKWGYTATTDLPTYNFWDVLAEEFPDAKV